MHALVYTMSVARAGARGDARGDARADARADGRADSRADARARCARIRLRTVVGLAPQFVMSINSCREIARA